MKVYSEMNLRDFNAWSGAVVTKNVKDYALMAGVPARQIGWVCECGTMLDEHKHCPECGKQYQETEHGLEEK